MPHYQPEVAIISSCVGLFSFGVLLLQRGAGRTLLPLGEEMRVDGSKDPLDVITPEDAIDGAPIDEDAFWKKVRRSKLGLCALLAASSVAQAGSLGLAVICGGHNETIPEALKLLFALYSWGLAIRTLGLGKSGHAKFIYHLFVLNASAAILLFLSAIVPHADKSSTTDDGVAWFAGAFWYTTLAAYSLSSAVVVLLPVGPQLYFPVERIYTTEAILQANNDTKGNVADYTCASIWSTFAFSYTSKVVALGNSVQRVEIVDLPVLPASMRAVNLYTQMRNLGELTRLHIGRWTPKRGSGWGLVHRLVCVNAHQLRLVVFLASFGAFLFYVPLFFLQALLNYLESDPERHDRGWGWVFAFGLFFGRAVAELVNEQLFSILGSQLHMQMKAQLMSMLYAKVLVRKDVASSSGPSGDADAANGTDGNASTSEPAKEQREEFASKAQVMTLMTTDVNRVSSVVYDIFTLSDCPVELVIGILLAYKILGVSCFVGLGVTCLFLPLNHLAGKAVVGTQERLMQARDKRISLMNEILGAIRMLKFMAWEHSFEERVMKLRREELKYQKATYFIETLFTGIMRGSPVIVAIVCFWHYSVVRGQPLTPAIAFTVVFFDVLKYALNALPESFISIVQVFVSLRRIEKYMDGEEIEPASANRSQEISLRSATITWPLSHGHQSAPSTAANRFMIMDATLDFPTGELSLICGRLGSGKSLLLLALLGEADVIAGSLTCPHTPPDFIASYTPADVTADEWIVSGVCAYVPQTAWLRNASIRDNILFELPYVEERYQKILEACALLDDLRVLEDGDLSEIGERGVNLSGGQKARVSLARAVYSRASVLLLDDVLSAVDAHTARHIYHECLKGELIVGRTVILVSHHVQLCYPGAAYVVALDNGHVQFSSDRKSFEASGILQALVQSGAAMTTEDMHISEPAAEVSDEEKDAFGLDAAAQSGTPVDGDVKLKEIKAPRKLIEEEKREVGHIGIDVWATYVGAFRSVPYQILFALVMVLAAIGPVFDNGWLRVWSGVATEEHSKSAMFYTSIYAAIASTVLLFSIARLLILYDGAMYASAILYERLLRSVLFATIRFHDTISRGRLLNRFGKDFESVDSELPMHFGRSISMGLSTLVSLVTISIIGGPVFLLVALLAVSLYYNAAKVYGHISRDMRRLGSVAQSPIYSTYGETISGVAVIRAFGASTKLLRETLRLIDTSMSPTYWGWMVNRWLAIRFNAASWLVIGIIAFTCVYSVNISAALAGFIITFAFKLSADSLWLVQRFVSLEQAMVAVERIKESTELPREAPKIVEPRPPASWPAQGGIKCEDLVIRYAPDLPDVLHNVTFEIRPGEKVGVIGRTGSGKSTLALSFFRFVEPAEGRILIDDIDISKIGLADLRSRLTIIPQDATIFSGTIRSMLDVFGEYEDAEIYEALRRVHLIPPNDLQEASHTVNVNTFRKLDSAVSEGGENFSAGEKQLLCMARAILKRAKILLMDEATASVDYATDELISKTIREEFGGSTILTIAHRIRTIIDYDRVMLLDEGRIVEFDTPSKLLSDQNSRFNSLCKATGRNEFAMLRKMAGVT